MRISSSRAVHLRSEDVCEQWGSGFEREDVSEHTWTLGLPLDGGFSVGYDDCRACEGGHDVGERGRWEVGVVEGKV